MTESELARAGLEIVEVEIAGAPLHRWQRRAIRARKRAKARRRYRQAHGLRR